MRYLLPLLLVPLVAFPAETDFPEDHRAAIVARVECYGAAWRANDPARVLANFTDDAVLMPHHGVEPVAGTDAIRRFWWPEGSPPTTVTRFDRTIDEIVGAGDFAFVRGHFTLEFRTSGDQVRATAGTYVMLLRRTRGRWLITHHMWDDPPRQDS
jgi:uncharacterized protein (TIGR02246 family)